MAKDEGAGERKRYSEPITPGQAPDARGLTCPRCGCHHFRVVETRRVEGGRIRRRRECRHCGWRVSTVEREVANGEDV